MKFDKVVLNNPALFRKAMNDLAKIPTVPMMYCEFDKTRRVLKLASEFCGMPEQLCIKSHHTGKTVRFKVVGPEDRLFDEDQWDGEQQIYRPIGHVPNVDHLVIYHQY